MTDDERRLLAEKMALRFLEVECADMMIANGREVAKQHRRRKTGVWDTTKHSMWMALMVLAEFGYEVVKREKAA